MADRLRGTQLGGFFILFEAGRPLVATVGQRGGGFVVEIKRRPDVELWVVTRDNRDTMPDQVLRWLDGRR